MVNRIPLFPLEVVLFPGFTLPLHIFEPRYKEMIRDCREQKLALGVVLAEGDELAEVACTAEIVTVAKEYENGELDIVTVGSRVCRILEVLDEHSYYEAKVEYLEDEPSPRRPPSTALLQLYDRCHQTAYGRRAEAAGLEKAVSAAFFIASELPLELSYKQKLLEMRNEEERRRSLEGSLAQWLEEVEKAKHARRLAGGNGHTHYT